MPKSGGEKALTKHEHVDAALKCSLEVEELGKIDQVSVGKLHEDNAFVICDLDAAPRSTLKQKQVVPVKLNLDVGKLGKVTRKLYDLDPVCGPEKPLKIDLDLYQMEDV